MIKISLVVFALATICSAVPARLKNSQQRKFSARQEVAEDTPSQTPYPPAGIIPQVRFDLPTEGSAVEPDNTYLPPDNAEGIPAKTYGPPDALNDEEVEIEEESETEQPEDLSESLEPKQEILEEDDKENDVADPQEEELLVRPLSNLRNSPARSPKKALRSQRLVAKPIPFASQRLIGQQLYFIDGRFLAYNPQYFTV